MNPPRPPRACTHPITEATRRALNEQLGEAIRAVLNRPVSTPDKEVNYEGLTFEEWLRAAVPGYNKDATFLLCLVREWEAGVDPTELRFSRHASLRTLSVHERLAEAKQRQRDEKDYPTKEPGK